MSSPHGFRWLAAAAVLAAIVAALALLPGGGPLPGDAPAARGKAAPQAPEEEPILDAVPAYPGAGPAPGARSAVESPLAAAPPPTKPPSASQDAWLKGRVLLPGLRPAPKARVALLELKDGAPLPGGSQTKAQTNGAGEFELAVPPWALGRTVLLVARRSGSAPYSERISIGAESLAKRHELHLGAGATISGRALRGGEPLPGLYVGIDIAFGIPGIDAAGRQCWWGDDRLQEKYAEARTDDKGYFQFAGLSPAEYRVEFQEPDAAPDRLPLHTFQVAAPTERVYDLTDAKLSVSAFDSAGPLAGAKIRASMEYGSREWQSGPDPFVLNVPANQPVQIELTHPSAEPIRREVLAPGPGQWQDVVLTTVRIVRPRLIVTLTSPREDPHQDVSLLIANPYGGAPLALVGVPLNPDPDASGGKFIVDAVPLDPGTYLVSLEPGPPGGALSFRYPDTRLVHLPRAGNAAVQFDHIRGGRCEIELVSDSDAPWSASYSLIDGEGLVCQSGSEQKGVYEEQGDDEQQDFEFTASNEFTETATGAATPAIEAVDHETLQRQQSERRARAGGVLRPGFYTLKVTSKDLAPLTQPVEIKAGNVTILRVPLQPKR